MASAPRRGARGRSAGGALDGGRSGEGDETANGEDERREGSGGSAGLARVLRAADSSVTGGDGGTWDELRPSPPA
jgi:hypothetical protein